MKWHKRLSLLFARESAITKTPNSMTKSEPAVIKNPESKTTTLLKDVWSVAVQKNWITIDKKAVENYLQSIGGSSNLDTEWKSSISNPLPYVATLENVTLIPGSKILIDEEGTALSDEIDAGYRTFSLRPKLWHMELSDGPHLSYTPPPVANEVISVGIHLTGEHEANYFHWVAEIMPRLYLYLKLSRENNIQLLVSDSLNEKLYEFLHIICGSERKIRRLNPSFSYRVSRLVYPSDVSRIFDFYDRAPSLETTYLPVALLRHMVLAIKTAIIPNIGRDCTRLYVKRVSEYRTLLNEAEIEKYLVERGFLSIDPGELSIKAQVELFGQADIVIGPSGAAITNIVWCRDQTKVLVLHLDHPFKKYPYWDALARVSGAHISYLPGPRAHNVMGLFEVHDDYSIQIDSIKHAMRELGCV